MSNRIRIISTSDIHGKVFPCSYADGREGEYGMLKLACLLERYRDENSILIDNGDILQGSPLQFYHMGRNLPGPSPVTRAMREMNYDYVNAGNHDFDYGKERLKEHFLESGAKPININMGYSYDVITLLGKKMGIFGILTPSTKKWEPPENIRGVELEDAFLMAKKTVEEIREKENPDYIICCYHGGLEADPLTFKPREADSGENQGIKMMREIEGLDILIAGHQHTVTWGTCNGKAFTQPGMDGRYLSIIDIYPDRDEIVPRLISLEDEKVDAHGDIGKLLREEEEECQSFLDRVIGKSRVDLSVRDEERARLEKPQFITFLNRVQMERMGGDIAASSLFEGATGLEDEITMRQILASYPFPNTLVMKRISGKVLKEYLERNAEFWELKDGRVVPSEENLKPIAKFFNYDLLDGVEYTMDISRARGDRITSMTKDGREIGDEEEFKIVLNSYRAAGGGDFSMLEELEILKTDLTDMVEILADYITKRREIDFEPVYNIEIRR